MYSSNDLLRVRTYHLIPPGFNSFHPFSFVPQCDTGNALKIRLFLYTAGVGEYDASVLFHLHHVQKGDGINKVEIADRWLLIDKFEAGARMDGKDNRLFDCKFL